MKKPKVIEIGGNIWEIKETGHTVSCKIKKGRRILTCTCTNHTKYCNENPLCYHKQLVLEYLASKPILEYLDKLVNEYKGYENIKAKIDAKLIVDDLNKIIRQIRDGKCNK